MPKFTQVRADTFENIQINAGIILSDFTPSTGTFDKTDIIGATTGGLAFNSNLETVDFGEDVDNVPANTWQLKRVTQFSPVVSGTFVTVDTALGKMLVAAAEADGQDTTHIIPSNLLDQEISTISGLSATTPTRTARRMAALSLFTSKTLSALADSSGRAQRTARVSSHLSSRVTMISMMLTISRLKSISRRERLNPHNHIFGG